MKNPVRAKSNLERHRVSIIERGSHSPIGPGQHNKIKSRNKKKSAQKNLEIIEKPRDEDFIQQRNQNRKSNPNFKPKKSVFKNLSTKSQTHNGFFRPAKTGQNQNKKSRKSLHQNKNYRKNMEILRKSKSHVGQYMDPSKPQKREWCKDKVNQTAAEISRLVFGDDQSDLEMANAGSDWSIRCRNLRANTENFSPNNHFSNFGTGNFQSKRKKKKYSFQKPRNSFVSVYSGGFGNGQKRFQHREPYDVFDKLSRVKKRKSSPQPDKRHIEKEKLELKECTFQPQINDLSRLINDIQNGRRGTSQTRTSKGKIFIFYFLNFFMLD